MATTKIVRNLQSLVGNAGTVSLAVLALAAFTPLVAAQNTNAHALTVSVWTDDGTGGGGTSATFSDADADGMFADANAIVLNSDQAGDVACDHSLVRSGSVTALHGAGSDGEIDSAEEFEYVLHGPSFVKVVPLISFCGRLEPGVAGCAPIGGGANSLLLAEWAAKGDTRGVALAHEFGHVVGLDHEANVALNFMQPIASRDNRNVTAAQCSLLRSDALDSRGPVGLRKPGAETGFAVVSGAKTVAYANLGELTIDQLAHSLFFQRTPVEVEDSFGEADLDVLMDLLQREEEHDYHPTIATLIGLLGGAYSDRAAVALVSFIDQHPGTAVSRVALSSLGHLAAYGNNYALDMLTINATQNSFYGAAAVVGLGVSGRAEARDVLQALQNGALDVSSATGALLDSSQSNATSVYGPAASLHRATISEAVIVNETIASVGRRGYYRD